MSDKPVKEMLGHEAKITQAYWGPLNETIMSCSDDGTVRVWNPEVIELAWSIDPDRAWLINPCIIPCDPRLLPQL